MGLDYSTAVAL